MATSAASPATRKFILRTFSASAAVSSKRMWLSSMRATASASSALDPSLVRFALERLVGGAEALSRGPQLGLVHTGQLQHELVTLERFREACRTDVHEPACGVRVQSRSCEQVDPTVAVAELVGDIQAVVDVDDPSGRHPRGGTPRIASRVGLQLEVDPGPGARQRADDLGGEGVSFELAEAGRAR